MGAVKNELGNRYGKLTVISRSDYKNPTQRGVYWNCLCDCGRMTLVKGTSLRSGNTTSCGHCSREHHEDLTNQRFGKLVALKYIGCDKFGKAQWLCQCDCGNQTIVTSNLLKQGKTKSCGCNKGGRIDLTGQRFGKLLVLKYTKTEKNVAYWLCQCDCGNQIEISSHSLVTGNTQSCGCLKSKGETLISLFLTNNHISFEREYNFSDLKDQIALRFDFAIKKDDKLKLIEFDGIQHFKPTFGIENFQDNQKHDEMKNQYCKKHNIPLLRLNYLQTKEEIQEEIKKFLDIE